jgi:hypothetical protein
MPRGLGAILLSTSVLIGGCVTSFDLQANLMEFSVLTRCAQDFYRAKGRWPRSARELMAWTVAQSDHPDVDFTRFPQLTARPMRDGNLLMTWQASGCTTIQFILSKPSSNVQSRAAGAGDSAKQ